MKMLTVALIEDDALVRTSTEVFLRTSGFRAICEASSRDLAQRLGQSGIQPHILLCDYRLSTMTALEAVPAVLSALPGTVPVIITTGDSSPHVREMIQAQGWHRMLKPYRPDELLSVLAEVSGAWEQSPPSVQKRSRNDLGASSIKCCISA